ncbi:MAG: hypothetical protein K8E66_03915, partial [Phycisphaerales bacterium]|nr:hypothetical protein [Phycisphaerales bacterium]
MARLRHLTGKLEDDRGVCHAQKPVHIKDRSSFRLQGWCRPSVPWGEGSDPCHLRAMLERQAIGRRAMENGPNRVLMGVIVLIFVAGAAAIWSESGASPSSLSACRGLSCSWTPRTAGGSVIDTSGPAP